MYIMIYHDTSSYTMSILSWYIMVYVCYMYACMYVCMYACMYACMYVCMYVCTYVCIHTYVCMYVRMYAYIHTYIHTYILTSVHGAGREAGAASSTLRGGRLVAYLCNRHYSRLPAIALPAVIASAWQLGLAGPREEGSPRKAVM